MKDSNIIFRYAQNPEDTKIIQEIIKKFGSIDCFLASVKGVVGKILVSNFKKQD